MSALIRQAHEQIRRSLAFLLAAQDADGLWRDYSLVPGRSEAWSTAWVGWHLSHFPQQLRCQSALRQAAAAVLRSRVPGGWGYNTDAGADADSTAWAIRFLCRSGFRGAQPETQRLSHALDEEGRAHTFWDGQHGAWSAAHDEVTPVVGLALLACHTEGELIERVRRAVISTQKPDGLWEPFWWACDAYASFWSVYFLRRSGGLPPIMQSRCRSALAAAPEPVTALETALHLLTAMELDCEDESFRTQLAHALLETGARSGWPGSPLLLVPKRREDDDLSNPGPHADLNGLMTTAVATVALARWTGSTGHPADARPIQCAMGAGCRSTQQSIRHDDSAGWKS